MRTVVGIGISGMARGPGRPFWDCGRTRGAAWRCTMWITREEAAVRSLDPHHSGRASNQSLALSMPRGLNRSSLAWSRKSANTFLYFTHRLPPWRRPMPLALPMSSRCGRRRWRATLRTGAITCARSRMRRPRCSAPWPTCSRCRRRIRLRPRRKRRHARIWWRPSCRRPTTRSSTLTWPVRRARSSWERCATSSSRWVWPTIWSGSRCRAC